MSDNVINLFKSDESADLTPAMERAAKKLMAAGLTSQQLQLVRDVLAELHGWPS